MEEPLMTVAIEPNNLGDLLKFEAPSLYSREEITVAQGQNLTLKQPLLKTQNTLPLLR
jgi:hypothetical protein